MRFLNAVVPGLAACQRKYDQTRAILSLIIALTSVYAEASDATRTKIDTMIGALLELNCECKEDGRHGELSDRRIEIVDELLKNAEILPEISRSISTASKTK